MFSTPYFHLLLSFLSKTDIFSRNYIKAFLKKGRRIAHLSIISYLSISDIRARVVSDEAKPPHLVVVLAGALSEGRLLNQHWEVLGSKNGLNT